MANESPEADENAGQRLRKVLGLRDLIPMQILIVIGPSWTGTAAHQAGTHVSFWILGTLLLFLPVAAVVQYCVQIWPYEGGVYQSSIQRTYRCLRPLARALAILVAVSSVEAKEPNIVMEEFRVPSSDAGIDLYIRNKHPPGVTKFAADKILLYVHGATYPAETAFDLKLNGFSWMDYIAQHGYDVYLVDIRGYGRSTRPREMDQPAADNEPIVRTVTAVQDVGTAVDFIRKRRGVSKIDLIGWSWGTTIMGWYTAQNNDKVNRLVLYAPSWISTTPSLLNAGDKLGAYRTVTRDAAKRRWLTGVPEDKKAALIPPGWFDAWADATFATDPEGAKQSPPVLRAPNGVVQDGREYWGAGKPLYDPGEIRVPTFLAHAEWDADLPSYMLYEYFAKLTNAPCKRYVQIGEGTHTVIMEKNRMQLFQEVQHFLDDGCLPSQ